MPHTYDGVNPLGAPIIPSSPTSGKGQWPDASVVDDGDERDAATAMAAVEAAIDRTNFIAWRMVNVIEGSTHAYTSTITLANVMVWNGAATHNAGSIWQNNATLQIGTASAAAALLVKSTSTAQVDGTCTLNGPTTINGAAVHNGTMTCNDTTIHTAETIYSTADGYSLHREVYVDSSNITIDLDMSSADTFVLKRVSDTLHHTLNFTIPAGWPATKVLRCVVRQEEDSSDYNNTSEWKVMGHLVQFGTYQVTTAVKAFRPASVILEYRVATNRISVISVFDPLGVVTYP